MLVMIRIFPIITNCDYHNNKKDNNNKNNQPWPK